MPLGLMGTQFFDGTYVVKTPPEINDLRIRPNEVLPRISPLIMMWAELGDAQLMGS